MPAGRGTVTLLQGKTALQCLLNAKRGRDSVVRFPFMEPVVYRFPVLLATGLAVSACAQTPESVAPSYISEVTYQNWTCGQLAEEQQRVASALTTASAAQNNARSQDIAGIILLGVPVSSMSGGNIAPEIARLKGHQEAIGRASTLKKCTAATPGTTPLTTPTRS